MKGKNIILQIVVALALITGGFFGGKAYQANKKPSFSGINGNFPTAFGSPPAGVKNGRSAGAEGDNSGSITAKDDKSITIKLSSGSMKTVYYTSSTTVSKQSKATVDDLSTGTNITVMGSSNSDGSVAAQSIQVMP
jgi:hypothetical protein